MAQADTIEGQAPRRKRGDPTPAGAADYHDHFADRYVPDADLPCADTALIVPLKRSPELRGIRSRIADHHLLDSWQDEGVHFFVYLLHGEAEVEAGAESPVVVFAMHPEAKELVSAVTVTPGRGGGDAKIEDLRESGNTYTAPHF